MLQEWNQTCWYRSNLLRWHVNIINVCRRNNWVISILTALNNVTDKFTFFCQRSITLTNNLSLFILSGQEYNISIIHVHLAVVNLTVRSNDKAKVIDLCIHTERRNQTDVWTFRTLNRTKTTIVSIVYVTNLETCTLTRQTTRTEGRKTTLVSYLSQWVGLVHELWQWVCTEEWVDNTRDGLGIDQICWCKHLIVTNVHTLTDCTAHTCQTDRELVSQLLANGTNTTVRQVVDIINCSTWVDELNQIFDNLDDIVLSQNTDIHICIETQLLINTVATYLTQIITLVWEEQVLEYFACTGIISRISITQLTINVVDSLLFRVTWVLCQCIEDDGKLVSSLYLFLV